MACSGECFSLVLWGKKCVSACWLLDNWGSLFISVAFKHTDLRQGKGEAEGGGLSYFSSCSYPFKHSLNRFFSVFTVYENRETVTVQGFKIVFSAERFVSELSFTVSDNEDRTQIIRSHHVLF